MTMSKSMNTLGALAIAAALAAGLFICLLLIVSCGQKPEEIKKDAFAENAERHLPMLIDVFYPQAANSKPEIAEKNTLYTDDSLHIASFVMKYQNALGVASENSITEGRFFCYRAVITKEPSPCMKQHIELEQVCVLIGRKLKQASNSSIRCNLEII